MTFAVGDFVYFLPNAVARVVEIDSDLKAKLQRMPAKVYGVVTSINGENDQYPIEVDFGTDYGKLMNCFTRNGSFLGRLEKTYQGLRLRKIDVLASALKL